MDDLPLDVCKIIHQYKRDMELFVQQPEAKYYISPFLEDERQIIKNICALSLGTLPTLLRVRDILEASVDLIDFYRESERIWAARHKVWGLTPYAHPPSCGDHLGYVVYQWLSLQGSNGGLEGMVANCMLHKFCFW